MNVSNNVVRYSEKYMSLAKNFHSGNIHLDSFLRDRISLDNGYGKTYVYLTESKDMIIGYYNIGTGTLDQHEEYGNGNSRNLKIGGAVHINGFALDERFRGIDIPNVREHTRYTIADLLLEDCIQRILMIRECCVGFSFITLCSTNEGYSLYKRNEFEDLDADFSFSVADDESSCTPMYLPIDCE